MGFKDLVKSLSNEKAYDKVIVDSGVIDSAVYYSKKSYPHEFLALFDGKIEGNVLYITSLIFLGGERSNTSASFNEWNIPPSQTIYGSIHSHPGFNSAYPSGADLVTFAKFGTFHIIVCEPYSLETMKAYDAHGNPAVFEVDKIADKYDEAVLKDLEELRDSMDDEDELKASFFDLEKDLSDFQDDSEKRNKYSDELDESFSDEFDKGYPDELDDSYLDELDESFSDELDDITSARGLDISVDEAMMLHESRGPYSARFSQDEMENFYNPPEIRIGGERINGQSSDLSIIIEFRDGKPVLKTYTNKKRFKYDDEDEK